MTTTETPADPSALGRRIIESPAFAQALWRERLSLAARLATEDAYLGSRGKQLRDALSALSHWLSSAPDENTQLHRNKPCWMLAAAGVAAESLGVHRDEYMFKYWSSGEHAADWLGVSFSTLERAARKGLPYAGYFIQPQLSPLPEPTPPNLSGCDAATYTAWLDSRPAPEVVECWLNHIRQQVKQTQLRSALLEMDVATLTTYAGKVQDVAEMLPEISLEARSAQAKVQEWALRCPADASCVYDPLLAIARHIL